MAAISYATHGLDVKNPITLKAAGLVAADTDETGVYIGKGLFLIRIVSTANEIASNDELYNVTFMANTQAATSTWKKLGGQHVFAALEVNGGEGDSNDAEDVVFAVYNPYDNAVRVSTFVNGTIATGSNFAVYAYPIAMNVPF